MTSLAGAVRRRTGRGALAVALRRRRRLGRWLTSQPVVFGVLCAVCALYALAATVAPRWFPLATVAVWVLLGGFFLRMRYLVAYFAVLTASAAVAVRLRDGQPLQPGVVIALGATALLVLLYARSRERVGVQGSLGDSMLVDLRSRLAAQGEVPPLGTGWAVETVLRPAYGDAFSGDFLVADRSGDLLEVVLVDVSGKGQRAGTRALLLSGAFGGLLGALPGERFLPAANAYLLRQQWDEGFATAVHLTLDLRTGAFRTASAGHPPAAWFRRGSGRWTLTGGGGPPLGVVPGAGFPAFDGVLGRGDVLLLYTDGLVEDRGRDIDLGIDRLLGQAERVVASGGGGAARILEGTRAGEADDRALVLVRRT